MLNVADRKERMEQQQAEGFQAWLDKSETKLMLSMIPPAPNPDLVKTLLRSAFDAGHGTGTGAVLMEVVETLLKDKKHPA